MRSLAARATGSRALTLHSLERTTGYARSRLLFALQALGLDVAALTPAAGERILAFLRAQPDGRKLYAIAGVKPFRGLGLRTAKGAWGVGTKPAACLGCQRSDRPHRARGFCATCIRSEQRREAREEAAA